MAAHQQDGMYRRLPQVQNDTKQFILDVTVPEFGDVLNDLTSALARVDDEMQGLSETNKNLADIVYGTVQGMYSVFENTIRSEQDKALLRVISYINALVVLRAVDMELRHG